MPLYEYRCRTCGRVTSQLAPLHDIARNIECQHGCGLAERIVSQSSIRLSKRSKVGRLDPKYDRMVDRAMRNTGGADPDRLLNRRGDIAKGKPDP